MKNAKIVKQVMKHIKIRRYEAKDRDQVWNLHNRCLYDVGAHAGNGPWDDDLHHINSIYLKAGGEFLVGEFNDEIVGMGALLRISKKCAEIKRMRIAPEFQRKGIGQLILKELENKAKQLGYEVLKLDTTTKQIAAQRLYEKNKYQLKAKTKYGPFRVLIYEKDITKF